MPDAATDCDASSSPRLTVVSARVWLHVVRIVGDGAKPALAQLGWHHLEVRFGGALSAPKRRCLAIPGLGDAKYYSPDHGISRRGDRVDRNLP